MVFYIDNILVFSSNLKEHTHHVRLVLTKLREYGLYAKSEKCELDRTSIEFLGYMISPTGITMDERKVAAITDWPLPIQLKEVQLFLGFANFYSRFIDGFSSLVQPLIQLTRKDTPFLWTPATHNAFNALKVAFLSVPVLVHPDPTRSF